MGWFAYAHNGCGCCPFDVDKCALPSCSISIGNPDKNAHVHSVDDRHSQPDRHLLAHPLGLLFGHEHPQCHSDGHPNRHGQPIAVPDRDQVSDSNSHLFGDSYTDWHTKLHPNVLPYLKFVANPFQHWYAQPGTLGPV